ncbi:MAG: hypothetical protein R6U20_05360 [Longimonas sp.]|uniref:ImmA/IrrE family metallo-endopeptidase n=1 Tax=Longimonas sp. TaxID=2039626 RepID=UPI0039757135
MDELAFDFEWVSASKTGIPEHDATWADVRIAVGSDPVTQIFDTRASSVRSRLRIPLYPLAEWIATNWWFLHYEVRRTGRSTSATYDRRHNMRFAREGYALPALLIEPQGDYTTIRWNNEDLQHYDIQFMSSGTKYVKGNAFSDEIGRLLNSVEQRLEDACVHNTLFQNEWDAIKQADDDEKAFCQAAAQLGCDPYALTQEQQQTIIQSASAIPREIHSAFYQTADIKQLNHNVNSLKDAVERTEQVADRAQKLHTLRHEVTVSTDELPWNVGYNYARHVRKHIGLNGQPLDSLDDVVDVFSFSDDNALNQHRNFSEASPDLFDGLVATANEKVGFSIKDARDNSKKFTLCRSIFQYLTNPAQSTHLATRALSEEQQKSRAFAAEFLAPSQSLEQMISGPVIDENEVEDIAEHYGVSTYVVIHQLNNHKLVSNIV